MIGTRGDANVILRNAVNVNQRLQTADYADAFLHVGSLACMPMHVACCSMSRRSIKEAGAFVMVLSSRLFFKGSNYKGGKSAMVADKSNSGVRANVSDALPNPVRTCTLFRTT